MCVCVCVCVHARTPEIAWGRSAASVHANAYIHRIQMYYYAKAGTRSMQSNIVFGMGVGKPANEGSLRHTLCQAVAVRRRDSLCPKEVGMLQQVMMMVAAVLGSRTFCSEKPDGRVG